MLHHKAFRFRIYPGTEQMALMGKMFGCCRFVFNHFLAKWNDTWGETGKGLSYHTCATGIPALKETYGWLKEADSVALQSSVRHLADSFDRFFRKQSNAPRFKSRKNLVQCYTTRFTNDNIAIQGNRLKLPKLGWIRFAKSREIQGRMLSAAVRRSRAGKYFVSIVCETDIQPLPPLDTSIGIDFGLKKFAVCSRGEDTDNPKHLRKQEKKLARWQRIMARRTRGGANWHRAKRKVARIHEKIANSRQDFLHQLTTRWIRENQTICLEDLQVSEMLQNSHMAKAISEVTWSKCRAILTYKSKWYERTISVVAKDYPSSQLCSSCGHRNPAVKSLALREWDCPMCGGRHDRDKNASLNIEKEGLRLAALTA